MLSQSWHARTSQLPSLRERARERGERYGVVRLGGGGMDGQNLSNSSLPYCTCMSLRFSEKLYKLGLLGRVMNKEKFITGMRI